MSDWEITVRGPSFMKVFPIGQHLAQKILDMCGAGLRNEKPVQFVDEIYLKKSKGFVQVVRRRAQQEDK